MMRRLLVGAAVVAVTVATLSLPSHAASAAARSTSRVDVLGYIESGDGLAVLRRDLPALASVGIDGVNIDSSGTSVSQPDADASAMLAVTHRAHKRAELLVGNFSGSIGDFDPTAASRLFRSAQHRRSVIAELVADTRHGWDGIQLDFESLSGRDRWGLTQFTTELRAALPRSKSLSMAVMASTSTGGYLDTGYDLRKLARQLTTVVLMAYDQHGPTWTSSGPVGGLPWARDALTAMLASVPRAKAIFGVAGYGYTWPARGTGTQLSDAASRRVAVAPTWDATQGEWHAHLRAGGSIWWSDIRSVRARSVAARHLGVDGVAIWSLGLCDRLA